MAHGDLGPPSINSLIGRRLERNAPEVFMIFRRTHQRAPPFADIAPSGDGEVVSAILI
jgi:hypothetical protein